MLICTLPVARLAFFTSTVIKWERVYQRLPQPLKRRSNRVIINLLCETKVPVERHTFTSPLLGQVMGPF
jgi:hypothetical protein